MAALSPDKLIPLRERKGWSQARTAREAGINQSYYSQLEKQRKTNPSDQVVRRLADVLGVDPQELVA